jgi:hypothetical protein
MPAERNMTSGTTDAATLQALLARLLEFRLPRLLASKEHVDGGARLDDT